MSTKKIAMLLVCALLPSSAFAEPPLGGEFRVNEHTTNAQQDPAVAPTNDGGFVVVWHGFGAASVDDDILGRRYDGAGSPVGGEFLVNSDTTLDQSFPALAADAAGNFVAVWQGEATGSGLDIFARRFDSSGAANGSDFRVNTSTASTQSDAAVGASADGAFVVVWQTINAGEFDVFGQRFAGDGTPIGGEFQVNTTGPGSQTRPAVASDADGDFVVAWVGVGADGQDDVFARRFSKTGAALGGEFQVNQFMTDDQTLPSVASDAGGNFVVTWEGGGAQDGDGFGVFARRFSNDGTPLGDEFQVNTFTTGDQSPPPRVARLGGTSRLTPGDLDVASIPTRRSSGGSTRTLVIQPSVASDANGEVVISWTGEAQDGSGAGVFGQRYNPSGAAVGDEFQVNTHTTGDQASGAVAWDTNGNFVVAWDSVDQDGSGLGVFAQRYAHPTATPTETPIPPTATPTETPVPPTATPTETPVPPTATATATAVPPTATPTQTPRPVLKPLFHQCTASAQCQSGCCVSILPPWSDGICLPGYMCH